MPRAPAPVPAPALHSAPWAAPWRALWPTPWRTLASGLAFALAVALSLAAPAGPAAAQVSAADEAAIRETIQAQVEAFRRDDGDAAFALASPSIRGLFGTPDHFMEMVRQGYAPVYRPRVFAFREIVTLHGLPTQKVHVVGPDGRPVTAFYPMSRSADGIWRIEGCYLEAPDETQV